MAGNEGRRKAAVITGASGGIGEDLAKLFAADGYDLVLVARSREGLDRVGHALQREHGIDTLVVPADLTDPAAPDAVYRAVHAAGWDVEALVNNAGFGLHGAFVAVDGKEATPLARELEMIQVNVAALTALTKLFVPGMVARGRGRVLNVASTAAFQPGPFMAVYYATKAYVLSFSEALAEELKGTGVTVTALCPGPTRTGFQKEAAMEGSRLVRSPLVMDSPAVARIGYRAMQAGRRSVVTGLLNKLLAQSTRFSPRALSAKIVAAAHSGA
jgi:short-subunit dehydrogenase